MQLIAHGMFTLARQTQRRVVLLESPGGKQVDALYLVAQMLKPGRYRTPMHTHGAVYALAMIATLGKAAIGGAGATLAVLGIVNAFISTIASSWVHEYAHSGIEAAIVPYLVSCGAMVGGYVGAKASRARK